MKPKKKVEVNKDYGFRRANIDCYEYHDGPINKRVLIQSKYVVSMLTVHDCVPKSLPITHDAIITTYIILN
jgi:hypothetical protein